MRTSYYARPGAGCGAGISRVLRRPRGADATLRPTRGSAATLLCAGLLVVVLAGCGPTSFVVTPISARQELVEEVVQRESFWAVKKIAVIDVDGVLQNVRPTSLLGGSGENPVSLFAEKLDKAAADKEVRAVVLRINSPGGGVTATDLMYAEVQRFREKTGKPVIAAMLDVAASGGYYLACAADKIYAQPTTVTGSIGVIMMTPEFAGTMQKIGVRMNVIKSGEMKDMGSPFREMNEKDRAVLQGLIDGMYARFLEVVGKSRTGIEPEQLRKLADGRVYLAAEAKEQGLIDEIGTLRDALAAAKQSAGLENVNIKVVQYSRPLAYRPNIYADGATPPGQVNLVNVQLPDWLTGASPQLMYLWAPGW
jgi:protease IV